MEMKPNNQVSSYSISADVCIAQMKEDGKFSNSDTCVVQMDDSGYDEFPSRNISSDMHVVLQMEGPKEVVVEDARFSSTRPASSVWCITRL